MAINAYVGTPGSGKTYEVVKSVILPAFMKGRRIVTNVVGVSHDKFLSYVEELNKKKKLNNKLDLSCLGEIIHVSDDDVLKSNFFPYKGSTTETIARNGDLICLDEVWRIFDDVKKIKDEHRSFIAEHRHFVNEKGHTSDLVVINQEVTNIPRFIKDRIESTYKMSKLLALGLSNRYRIDVYSGSKLFNKYKITSIQSKYDKQIFELYSSYDGNNANEVIIDDRINFFKSGSFIAMFVSSVLFLFGGIYFAYDFFNIESEDNSIIKDDVDSVDEKSEKETNRLAISKKRVDTERKEELQTSTKWRIVGYLKKQGNNLVILSDGKNIRYEYLSNFTNKGNLLHGQVDGYRVTIYSGTEDKKEVFR
ncbi:hypothetical protein A1D23_03020 [Chelonobacter oris]|uniref:zonular occludens toxin family protein n=1 Tax=Chelonobacter oris TaxID=505317 RepID=UPI002449E0C1|nr:zonular occludens toxin domain-containing protein [Chelonobacter oris]MDH3001580.1 hypothetical protein [Chelonobacter oris]